MQIISKTTIVIIGIFVLCACGIRRDYSLPHEVELKAREIRAVWIPTIYHNDYKDLPRTQAKELLSKRLKALSDMGCNMVLFQIRSEGDCFYNSQIEPTSRFLLSTSINKEKADWDPLAFVVKEAHKYGMEVHAWINPYRAWANTDVKMPYNHPAKINPDWVIKYGKQLIFDPGNPDYRVYLMSVIKDIILRYDVDGIHFDDYFYPYPQKGLKFDDEKSFIRYGVALGYNYEDRDIWRRNNINLFVDQLNDLVTRVKPWLRISVSPFGIYRNKNTNSVGSNTNGIQCYDDLYADVKMWIDKGWIDYVIPQVYWSFADKRADYGELVPWWNKATKGKVTLIIGQNIKSTMNSNQLYPKWLMSNEYASGNSWWASEDLWNNYKGIADSLKNNYQRIKVLMPEVKGRLGKTTTPKPLTSVVEDINEDGHMIIWDDIREPDDPEMPFMFGVYAIPEGYKVEVNKNYLVSISSIPHFMLPSMGQTKKYTFLITTINRFWQESEPMTINVVL